MAIVQRISYSINDDFNNSFNISNFNTELKNSSIGSLSCLVSANRFIVLLGFNKNLSTEEQATLDALVANHDSTPDPPLEASKQLQITFPATSYDSSNYQIAGTFKYPGNIIQSVSHIQVISNMDTTATNYTLRIKNHANNDTICEQTFTNTEVAICNFDVISNLPTANAIFELQIKRLATGIRKYAYVNSLIMHYS